MIVNRYWIATKRAVFSVLRYAVRDYVYAVRSGLAKGLKRRGGLGFIPQIVPLTREEKWLRSQGLAGRTVYDIGAFEGVFTLFFARAVGEKGKVVTFEPHPENCARVRENVRLNNFRNVDVRQIALGRTAGEAVLVSRRSEFGTASLHEKIKTEILKEKGAKTFHVTMDSLDHQIASHNLPKPDFVKIDVEGLEMDVLLGMVETIRNHTPELFIEIHDVYLDKKTAGARQVVDFLTSCGYSLRHIESGRLFAAGESQTPEIGHFYCGFTSRAQAPNVAGKTCSGP